MNKIALLLFVIVQIAYSLTEISSLPVTLNTTGETYFLSSDLECTSGDAITVSAANVTILGHGYTITHGITGAGDCIEISQHITSLSVDSLNSIQGHTGGKYFTNGGNYNPRRLTITNCNIRTDSAATGEAIYSENISQPCTLTISLCTLTVNTPNAAEAHAIWYHASGASGAVTGRIHHNYITLGDSVSEGRSSGLTMQAIAGAMQVDSNIITLNNYYQGEGIVSYFHGEKTIFGNTINMNCNQCRGITIDGNTDNSIIRKNIINANVKTTPDAVGHSHAIRLRFGSDDNMIDSNTISIIAGNVNGIAIGGSDPSSADRRVPKRDTVRHNIITSTFGGILVYDGTLDTIRFESNKVTVTGTESPITIQTTDTSCYDVRFVNDTISGVVADLVDFVNLYGNPGDPIAFYGMNINSSNTNGDTAIDYINYGSEPLGYVWDTIGVTVVDTAYNKTSTSISWVIKCKTWLQNFWLQSLKGGTWASRDSSVSLAVDGYDTLTINTTCDSIRLIGTSTKE